MNHATRLQPLFDQARQAYAAGRHADAVTACDRLISVGGQREEFLNLKAMSLLAQGRARDAARVLERALKKNPRSTGMHLNAARIELVLSDKRKAKRHVQEALRGASREPRVLYQAAVACRQCDDYDQALRLVDRCKSLAPELAEAHHLKGSMLLDQGHKDAAGAEFEAALECKPDYGRALADLSRLAGDEEEEALKKRLEIGATRSRDPWDRSACLFALADLHDRAGDVGRATSWYRQANETGAALRPFDLESWEAKQSDTLERYQGLEPGGPPGQGKGAGLLFLVGMPRSGTSLMERVLGAHPDVLACGELTGMHAIELHSEPSAGADERRRRYLAGLPRNHNEVPFVTDKLPMNFERVGMIHELFPGARFIHCRRHPLDTLLSCYQQDFQSGVKWAFSLEGIARVAAAEHRLMGLWKERLPDHVLSLDYESLVSDIGGTVNRLTDFLGLDAEPAMLEPHRGGGTVQTASRLQVRQSVYTTSVAKWKRYESLLNDVADRLRDEGLAVD